MAEHSHLSIGEVLSLLQDEFPDVTISKIRFLESQGLLDPERTPSGYRKFYAEDIDRLRWILTEQREHFLPLKVIKDRLEEHGPGVPPPTAAPAGPPSTDPSSAPGEDDQAPTDGRPVDPRGEVDASTGTLPIWMADVAREQAARKAAAIGRSQPDVGTTRPSPLDAGPTAVTLTRSELAHASGLTDHQIGELEQYGLLGAQHIGDDEVYDGNGLVVSQKAAALFDRGLSARHLRAFKLAADREAALFEQLVMPLLKQRNAEGRARAVTELAELTALTEALHAALLRTALRGHLHQT